MLKRLRPVLLAGLFLLQATAGFAQAGVEIPGKLLPTDEAVRDPQLFAFRAQLQAAVARHDVQAVLDVVHPNIKNSFGGSDGFEEFKKKWKLQDGESALWAELGTVLALGGSFRDKDNFVAPYVFSRWPKRFDAFQHAAVVGTGVRVRSQPGAHGAILASLTFDIVQVEPTSPDLPDDWTPVKLRDGRKGYIASRYVRSPIDYRAFLSRENGRWRLNFFVAGD